MAVDLAQDAPPPLIPTTPGDAPVSRALLVYRWPDRGADVRALITLRGIEYSIAFAARDVCAAVALDLPQTLEPGQPPVIHWPTTNDGFEVIGLVDPDGLSTRFWSPGGLATVLTEHGPLAHRAAFSAWIATLLADLAGQDVPAIIDAQPLPEHQPAVTDEETYSVWQAAAELADRGVPALGGRRLFEYLEHEARWVVRHRDKALRPNPRIRRAGLLTTRDLHQVPGRASYPQIRVTARGIDALAGLLTPPAQPTLLDGLA